MCDYLFTWFTLFALSSRSSESSNPSSPSIWSQGTRSILCRNRKVLCVTQCWKEIALKVKEYPCSRWVWHWNLHMSSSLIGRSIFRLPALLMHLIESHNRPLQHALNLIFYDYLIADRSRKRMVGLRKLLAISVRGAITSPPARSVTWHYISRIDQSRASWPA